MGVKKVGKAVASDKDALLTIAGGAEDTRGGEPGVGVVDPRGFGVHRDAVAEELIVSGTPGAKMSTLLN